MVAIPFRSYEENPLIEQAKYLSGKPSGGFKTSFTFDGDPNCTDFSTSGAFLGVAESLSLPACEG